MKIGITGATGFIGSYLVRCLPELGPFELRALTRTLSRAGPVATPQVEWTQGDLSMPADCRDFARGLDAIVHLAHLNSPVTSDRDLPADVLGSLIPTLNLIEALRELDTRPHVVFASSGGTLYADCPQRHPHREEDPCIPTSSYGIQKLTMELYLQIAARNGWLTATSLRIANAYGVLLPAQRKQGFIGVALTSVLQGRPVRIFGDPHNVRDYVHLEDITRAVALSITHQNEWSVYNIGSGQGRSVLDVLKAIESILGRPVPYELHTADRYADQLIPWSVLDVSRAERELGWMPRTSFEDGLRSLVDKRCTDSTVNSL